MSVPPDTHNTPVPTDGCRGKAVSHSGTEIGDFKSLQALYLGKMQSQRLQGKGREHPTTPVT